MDAAENFSRESFTYTPLGLAQFGLVSRESFDTSVRDLLQEDPDCPIGGKIAAPMARPFKNGTTSFCGGPLPVSNTPRIENGYTDGPTDNEQTPDITLPQTPEKTLAQTPEKTLAQKAKSYFGLGNTSPLPTPSAPGDFPTSPFRHPELEDCCESPTGTLVDNNGNPFSVADGDLQSESDPTRVESPNTTTPNPTKPKGILRMPNSLADIPETGMERAVPLGASSNSANIPDISVSEKGKEPKIENGKPGTVKILPRNLAMKDRPEITKTGHEPTVLNVGGIPRIEVTTPSLPDTEGLPNVGPPDVSSVPILQDLSKISGPTVLPIDTSGDLPEPQTPQLPNKSLGNRGGKGIRKIRRVVLRKSVLSIIIGRQLAGPTCMALKLLADGKPVDIEGLTDNLSAPPATGGVPGPPMSVR